MRKRDSVRTLIAGGAGYVGSALIPQLLERGQSIDVVDLFWFGNHLDPQVGVIHKDIFDLQTSDLAGYDQVVFLAGLSNDPMAEFSPAKNFIYNAAAPAYLAYTAKKAGAKRFIYASSCSFMATPRTSCSTKTAPSARLIPTEFPSCKGNAQCCRCATLISQSLLFAKELFLGTARGCGTTCW